MNFAELRGRGRPALNQFKRLEAAQLPPPGAQDPGTREGMQIKSMLARQGAYSSPAYTQEVVNASPAQPPSLHVTPAASCAQGVHDGSICAGSGGLDGRVLSDTCHEAVPQGTKVPDPRHTWKSCRNARTRTSQLAAASGPSSRLASRRTLSLAATTAAPQGSVTGCSPAASAHTAGRHHRGQAWAGVATVKGGV